MAKGWDDGERGRGGDGGMGRWGDKEMGRWGDKGKIILNYAQFPMPYAQFQNLKSKI
ncbi:MAG: hypothetical protein WBA39_00705 [Rivularia sp. (in: cyanobacteria)]